MLCAPGNRGSQVLELEFFEDPEAFAAFASGEGWLWQVIFDDLETVGEESGEILHGEAKGRAFFSRIEVRIDEPNADEQTAGTQGEVDAAAVVGPECRRERAHAGMFQDEVEGGSEMRGGIE